MSSNCLTKSETRADRVSFLVYPLIWIIYLYRITLSPFIGQSCRYYPTCSHYAEDALKKYGLLRGSWKATLRVFRCHPWHAGGYDPVK